MRRIHNYAIIDRLTSRLEQAEQRLDQLAQAIGKAVPSVKPASKPSPHVQQQLPLHTDPLKGMSWQEGLKKFGTYQGMCYKIWEAQTEPGYKKYWDKKRQLPPEDYLDPAFQKNIQECWFKCFVEGSAPVPKKKESGNGKEVVV